MVDSGLLIVTCCALFEFLFLHKCVHRFDDIMGTSFYGGQFDCAIKYNDTPNQVVISEFGGVFSFKNAKEQDHCTQELSGIDYDSSNINNLLEVCKMELRSLKIKTNEHTDFSNLSTIERYAGNITELTWEVKNRYTVNKLSGIFNHIKVLKIVIDTSGFNDFHFDFNSTFLSDMEKLQKLKLQCTHPWDALELPIELFQGLTNLSELTIEDCRIQMLSAAHFQDLTNLRVLNIIHTRLNSFDFLRSETLAKHVSIVDILSANSVVDDQYTPYIPSINKYTNFENYTNLQRLTATYKIPQFNKGYRKIFRTLCNYTDCELYFDQYGTECPQDSECTYNKRSRMGLIIDCHNRAAVMELKELPKHYSGTTALLLTSLNLTKLPNNSIGGYSSVQTLNVTDNQLDDINISQLPENITRLDIRNNNINDLGPEVIDFLQGRIGRLLIYISGNPWTCDCYGDFLKFLQRNQNRISDIDHVQCDGVTPTQKREICRMRIIYVIIAVAILLIVVGAIVYWFRKSKSRENSSRKCSEKNEQTEK